MIMTDQDHDGSHIKGLLMNFMHHFYPSLLKVPGFLIEFITPIVKVTYATALQRPPSDLLLPCGRRACVCCKQCSDCRPTVRLHCAHHRSDL
jgi:hypothetical protein